MIITSDSRKAQLVRFAKEEGLLKLKGDSKKAGYEIEKFLSPCREILGKSDPRYLDISFGFDWCAMFIYYLAVKSGYTFNIQPFKNKRGTFGLVGIWFEWGELDDRLKERSYEPEPGELVIYDRLLSDSELDHIGIVLENNTNYLLTAEGNVENMTGIFRREKDYKIRGYIKL